MKDLLCVDSYIPRYTVSENGVGYMPSSEIAKTNGFKRDLEQVELIERRRAKVVKNKDLYDYNYNPVKSTEEG